MPSFQLLFLMAGNKIFHKKGRPERAKASCIQSFCPFRACSYKTAKLQSLRLAMQKYKSAYEFTRTPASS